MTTEDQGGSQHADQPRKGSRRISAATLLEAFVRQYRNDRNEGRNAETQRTVREYLTIAVLIATAIVAALQWHTLDKTDRTLRLQERAWLTPIGLQVASHVATGVDLPIQLFYANLGKGPALSMDIKLESVVVPFDKKRPSPLLAGNNRTCDAISLKSESVPIFPVPNKDQWHNTIIPGARITDAVVAGEMALLVRGCIKYLTVEEEHATAFCYVAYRNGAGAAKNNTETCADGNGVQ